MNSTQALVMRRILPTPLINALTTLINAKIVPGCEPYGVAHNIENVLSGFRCGKDITYPVTSEKDNAFTVGVNWTLNRAAEPITLAYVHCPDGGAVQWHWTENIDTFLALFEGASPSQTVVVPRVSLEAVLDAAEQAYPVGIIGTPETNAIGDLRAHAH